MGDPLAGKLCELFVVSAYDHLERFVHQIFVAFDLLSTFDEETQSTDYCLFAVLWLANYLSDNVACWIGATLGILVVETITCVGKFQFIANGTWGC